MEKYDKGIEEKWAERWVSGNIYEFRDDGRPVYSIDTPPPFTSGRLHIGHVLSYSLFDFAARYRRMRGFSVLYPQGWDTHGFPTEVKVEKKYGKKLPREEFVQKCTEWTNEFIGIMRGQMRRVGFSADWKREYVTMSDDYVKKVQLSLVRMHKDGLVYRGTHPVFWCPHCVSAIAKSETEELERDTKLNFLKFRLTDSGGEIIIATTRPEYLHACVAVFVHPDDERYGSVVGKEIETPLGKKVKIYTDVDVDKEFGSGAVMVCTFGDKQDAVWVYRHNLPIVDAIDEYGRLKNAGEFDGLKLKDAREKIIEKLAREEKVAKTESLNQVVKVHDRCKHPIELKVSEQWFCKVDGFQRDIIKAAKEMKWIPEFTLQYMIDWTNYIEWDWVISRQRHFGTPLPFYNCRGCGAAEPVDESELPFRPERNAKKRKCPKCGSGMEPEKSTCDGWVDSSITPLVIAGWPGEGWEKYYPSTLRPQGIEIIRSWAFYTTYRCLMLTGKPPFRELLLNGNVLGPDGKKMSKSLGNVVEPTELIEKYSADAMRIWVAQSGAATRDRPFNYQDMKYAQSFINKLWNAARFVEVACSEHNRESAGDGSPQVMDRWILGKLEMVKEKATKAYEEYDYFNAINTVQGFFWHDFCDNYLEFVKHRIYGDDAESKRAAQKTLLKVLETSLKLMAPVIVFVTEEIYSQLFAKGEESIHLSQWPEAGGKIDAVSAEAGELAIEAASEIRKYKSARKMSVKEEVPLLRVSVPKGKDAHWQLISSDLKKTMHVSDFEVVLGESVAIVE